MKRFWQTCLAVVAAATMANTANAQSGEIGSYQSILSRAGYGESIGGQAALGAIPTGQAAIPSSPGTPITYGGGQGAGCAGGVCNGIVNGGGGVVNSGGIVNGGIVDGGMYNGGMYNGVINGGIVDGGMYNGGGAVAGSVVAGGVGGEGLIGVPCGTYDGYQGYTGGGYDVGYNAAPVYTPGQNISSGLAGSLGGGQASNLVVGLFGLNLRRDYEDDRRLGFNGAGTQLFTTDADHGDMDGIGASVAKRGANGSGWEGIFWGLDEDTTANLAGPSFTRLNGLTALDHIPSGANVYDIYNAGDNASVTRNTQINNFEFNMLRNGGLYTTRRGKSANYELLAGFRLFQFDEDLQYASNSSVAGYPTRLDYDVSAENLLTGFQVGGRREVCLSNRFRLSQAATFGLFNNRIETRQRITDETGNIPVLNAGPSAGRNFDYSDRKDDAAVLGQFDIGSIYQFSQKARARIGYRALGVAGVALAGDQIPHDFTDADALQRANSNGSLLLHGFFYGGEVCF